MPKPTPLSRLRPPRPTELRYWRDGGWCYYPNTGPMKNSKKKSNKKKMPPPAPTPDIREAMHMAGACDGPCPRGRPLQCGLMRCCAAVLFAEAAAPKKTITKTFVDLTGKRSHLSAAADVAKLRTRAEVKAGEAAVEEKRQRPGPSSSVSPPGSSGGAGKGHNLHSASEGVLMTTTRRDISAATRLLYSPAKK